MTNDKRLLTNDDSDLIKQLSISIFNQIIPILQQHPELVVENYQRVDWSKPKYQSAFIAGLYKKISNLVDNLTLLPKIKEYLEIFLVPSFFTAPDFHNLEVTIIDLIQPLKCIDLNNQDIGETIQASQNDITSSGLSAIAILLLDAENLQIDTKTEKFLSTFCTYPLQIKIAFANWCSMGKRDVELHQRGYELIHVPSGKDNADGKMIALGSSVHERYANAKEVIVCSSDKVMTNLCNHLQQYGLIVYQVIKKDEVLRVFNSSTGKKITQFPQSAHDIPTPEQFVEQIKQLIKTEQEHNQIFWVKLSTLSQAFKNKHNFSITQIIHKHFPGKKAKDVFMNYPQDFAVHQVDSTSELYITLFQVKQILADNKKGKTSLNNENNSNLSSSINSPADLEKVLQAILNELTIKSQTSYIYIGLLGSEFSQRYHLPITEQIKSLKLHGNFIKFLQSCNSFNLKQTQKGWQVALG